MSQEAKPSIKKDFLRSIEKQVQQKWADARVFELDAEETASPKYVATFPYPYMNGRLHLGHVFTITKAEYAVGFERMNGKKALFPFGFHCTGMPIMACAIKLKREIDLYGNPPKFPEEEEVQEPVQKQAAKKEDPTAFHSKKGKVQSKSLNTYQWKIMESMGVPSDEIAKFTDPLHWFGYFPPHAISDLKKFGARVDWRRSFITTDVNPYYDSFVRWQFETLKDLEKVKFGKRPAIWSPIDNQPCADHDRASGEGVTPQDYTLVKMKVIPPFPEKLAPLTGKSVFLVAATLRPETMYGQTNCFVLPDGEYGAFEINDDEVFISTERAAKNLAFQGYSKVWGQHKQIIPLSGHDLLGLPLDAPLAPYSPIYTLPMLTISPFKGTGVVTSVPSDSPDDYTALNDLKKKAPLRQKFNIKDEWVLPFEPVAFIKTSRSDPEKSEYLAKVICDELKITAQGQKELLEKAKDICYELGFYEGVLTVGCFAGQKVSEVKVSVKNMLIEKNQAVPYSEPAGPVVSRTGADCVVALTDQWYLVYGEPEWRAQTQKALDKLETYNSETKSLFNHTLGWMNQWAFSRSFGLGTRLPWDPQYLIESLSDSTIYMAYYTVAHLLQSDLKGSTPGSLGIKPEQLTRKVWDFVFLGKDISQADTEIPLSNLQKLRTEFLYWYPVDLRVSGKDLIQNHLTFYLYNHTAIFPEQHWPAGIKTNGHVLLNGKKMSKSQGNFMTLEEGIEKFSADGMRIALAEAGDTNDDSNFAETTANSSILRLYGQIEFYKKCLEKKDSLPEGPASSFADRVFESEINRAIEITEQNYISKNFRGGLQTGFWDLQTARDNYRTAVLEDNMKRDLTFRFMEVQALLLVPIAPHFAEYVWSLLGKEGFAVSTNFPKAGPIDYSVLKQNKYLLDQLSEFRIKLQLALKPQKNKPAPTKPTVAKILICESYPLWKQAVLHFAQELQEKTGLDKCAEDKVIIEELRKLEANGKALIEPNKVIDAMSFFKSLKSSVKTQGVEALQTTMSFNEKGLFETNIDLIKRSLNVNEAHIVVLSEQDAAKLPKPPTPGAPVIQFSNKN